MALLTQQANITEEITGYIKAHRRFMRHNGKLYIYYEAGLSFKANRRPSTHEMFQISEISAPMISTSGHPS